MEVKVMKEKSVITIEAKEEIRKNIAKLKEILKDDKEFAEELVDKILSAGQGIPVDIKSLIYGGKLNAIDDYRDPQYSKNNLIKSKLSDIWFNLRQIMGAKEFCNGEQIDALSEEEYEKFMGILFNDTLNEIYDAFYENSVEILNVADMNLMGE
jgi:hypothetical protein